MLVKKEKKPHKFTVFMEGLKKRRGGRTQRNGHDEKGLI